jgi:hypothetical protein
MNREELNYVVGLAVVAEEKLETITYLANLINRYRDSNEAMVNELAIELKRLLVEDE